MNHSEWIRTLRGLLQLAGEKLEVHSEDVELGYETEPADAVEARTRWELALSRVNRPYQAFLRSNTATEEQKAAVRDTWRTAQRTWKQGEDLNRTVDFAADAISKLDAALAQKLRAIERPAKTTRGRGNHRVSFL